MLVIYVRMFFLLDDVFDMMIGSFGVHHMSIILFHFAANDHVKIIGETNAPALPDDTAMDSVFNANIYFIYELH